MDAAVKKELQITACKVRMGILEGVHAAKSGHPGGSLSSADILTYLYFKQMNIDPKNPKMENRDRFVLSKVTLPLCFIRFWLTEVSLIQNSSQLSVSREVFFRVTPI